jgi:SAM-dependent methyltransferase
MSEQPAGLWAAGEAYEPYVGRWSRLVAPEFVRWLAAEFGGDWLDVGCGTGELTNAIIALADPRSVRGIDPSEGMMALAKKRISDPRVRFSAGDAEHLGLDDETADYTVSGLVLTFASDAAAAVRECARVTRRGGVVAAYVWDYAGEMQMMRRFWDAAVALDPEAAALDEGRRCSFCNADGLASLWRAAGLRDVATRAIDVPTLFADFDDYWTPFLAGQAPAPHYAMSLDERRRERLRDRIRASLPVAADGSIALIARAWAVHGVR